MDPFLLTVQKKSKKATFACARAWSLNYRDCLGDKVGKISIKYISQITGIHHTDVISQVAKNIEDIDVDPDIIKYSEEIGKKLSPYLKEAKDKGISLKGTINDIQ